MQSCDCYKQVSQFLPLIAGGNGGVEGGATGGDLGTRILCALDTGTRPFITNFFGGVAGLLVGIFGGGLGATFGLPWLIGLGCGGAILFGTLPLPLVFVWCKKLLLFLLWCNELWTGIEGATEFILLLKTDLVFVVVFQASVESYT